MPPRVLTGIKPTGSPHVGNLLGAIRPALALADEGLEAMYFIADYHALTTVHDAQAETAPADVRGRRDLARDGPRSRAHACSIASPTSPRSSSSRGSSRASRRRAG